MRDFVIVIIVLGSIPLILVRPYIGILLWFWLGMMNPHRMTWGYAQEFRVALVVGGATLFAWIVSRERKLPPATGIVYALAAFTAWVSLAALFALKPEISVPKWEEIIKIMLMSFVTMCIVQTRERIHYLVWVIAMSIGFYGIKGGVFAILTGGDFRVWGPPGTFIEDNNALALALIVTLPLIQYLRINTPTWWIRLGLTGAMGLMILSILASYSRGALIGIAVTLGFMFVKAKRRFLLLLIGGGVLALGLVFAPAQWYQRMDTIQNYNEDQSVQGRFDAWTFAWKLALDHPLVGGGQLVGTDDALFKHYVPTAPIARAAHSIYFEVLGEDGFVGLGLFLILLFVSFRTASRILRLTRDKPELAWARSLAAMIQVSFIGYAVTGAFLSLGFFDLYYALVAVIACTDVVVRRELEKLSKTAASAQGSDSATTIGKLAPAYASTNLAMATPPAPSAL
jgi:putative inorganic carbon (hco3(-)) transporter